jgi:hypothetical protein
VQDPELEVEPLSSLKDSTKDSPTSSAVPRGPNVTVNQRPASTGTSTGTCEFFQMTEDMWIRLCVFPKVFIITAHECEFLLCLRT